MPIATSACSVVTTNGGASRIERSPQVSTSSPRSKHDPLDGDGGVVVGEIEADHQPAAAYAQQVRLHLGQLRQPPEEVGADGGRVGGEPVLDEIERGEGRCARRRGCRRRWSRGRRAASP